MKIGLNNLENSRNFSSATWIFMMKARHGWREEAPAEDEDNDLEFEF